SKSHVSTGLPVGRNSRPTSIPWRKSASSSRPSIATDRKSTRLNSSHVSISYAVCCLKKKNWYVAVLILALILPLLVPAYLGVIVLVFIYGLCGLSLMVLAGYIVLLHFCHSEFL